MIKYIIFDLDGVLFDGCDLHATLFINAISKVRPDIYITKEYHDIHLNALSTRSKLGKMNVIGNDADAVYKLKQEFTGEYIVNNVKEDIKNKELCSKLISLNYKLYCVTNSIKSTVEEILKRMNIINFFSGIISNQDTTEPKPSPQPYITLFNKYKLNPSECLIIEDSPNGIESATRSGANVYCVRNCDDVTIENILNKIYSLNHSS